MNQPCPLSRHPCEQPLPPADERRGTLSRRQSVWRDASSVAAILLGRVQCAVGGAQERCQRRGRRTCCDACAKCELQGLARARPVDVSDRASESLRDEFRFFASRIDEQHDEFFAAPARQMISTAASPTQCPSDSAKRLIADEVAVHIVDAFEVIDVGDDD